MRPLMSTADFVLDARSAVLLLTDKGRAAKHLRTLTHDRTIMDWVSFAEVLAAFERDQGPEQCEEAQARLTTRLSLVAEIDPSLAEVAAHVRARYDVGIANAFAIALAITYDAVLVTANEDLLAEPREWEVEDLRPYLLATVEDDLDELAARIPETPAELVDQRLRGRLRARPARERAQQFYGA